MTAIAPTIHTAQTGGPIGTAETVIVLLHGFGSHEGDLPSLVPLIAEQLGGDVAWASLRAPFDLPTGGAAWFPITTPGVPDVEPVLQATQAIWQWVDASLAPTAHIVPIGFSQGGLMATQLLRTRPDRVAATVVFGGFVLQGSQPVDTTLAESRPAVFWGRGGDDHVIARPAIERTEQWLPEHSALEAHVYPGLTHAISREELLDATAFIAAHTRAGDARA
jgi:phospholipase/carboxylesterase